MMTIRNIHGLTWRSRGPSYFELEGYPVVNVCYLGATGRGADGANAWFLHCPDDRGEPMIRGFKSRDEACAMVAEAFRA